MMLKLQRHALPLAIGLLSLSGAVHAQLAQNISVDIRALSLGNAVTADPPGLSAVHYNPAALTRIEGLQTDLQGLLADFQIHREFSAPPDFNVFGYSDDPVVCNDEPNDGESNCSDFKPYGVSKIEGAALYVPVAQKYLRLPKHLPLAAPLAAVGYKAPGSNLAFATAFYAPFAAGFYQKDGDPGNYMGRRVALERFTYLSPSMAFKVTDNLSLGGSIGLSYQAIAMRTDLRFPNDLIGVLRLIDEDICGPFKEQSNFITDLLLFGLCNAQESVDPFKKFGELDLALEQSVSPSYNLGLLYEPSNDWGFGMVYQSASKMKLKGRYKIHNERGGRELIRGLTTSVTGQILVALLGFPTFIPENESGHASLDLEYPAHFQMGFKYKFMPEMQFNVDVGWTDYEAWQSFDFVFDREVSALRVAKLLSNGVTPNSLSLPLKFQSPWSWGVGWEYSMTDRLKFRFGYEPRKSALPDNRRNPLIPITNTQLMATGIGYRFDQDTDIDLSASFFRSRDNIPANTSGLSNKTGVNNLLLNPYAGLDIKTNTKVVVLGIAYRTRW